ncbi:type VI secretion system protein TssA, partial [Pseudomonas aeruginosa]
MTLPLSGNALSLEVLLEPIDPGQPCGPSLRYDPDYDRLRELRREDDSSLPTGVWQAEAKRADWAAVEQLASDLLQRRSKDLMLAAWLGEAWLQRGGLGGLQRALVLLAELCERYPEEVHPQAQDGDQSWRVPPIDWLLRRYAELLHTRLPLMGQGAFAEITLYAWQRLQRQQVASGDSAQQAKAEKLYREAAQTSPRARARLGKWLAAKPGASDAEHREAERLLSQAFEQGEDSALVPLIVLYLQYPQSWPEIDPQQRIDQWRARGLPQADLAQIILYRTQGTYAQHLGEIEQVCQRWLRRMDVCWYELATVYQMQGNAEKQKALLEQLRAAYKAGRVPGERVDSVAGVLADGELGQPDPQT